MSLVDDVFWFVVGGVIGLILFFPDVAARLLSVGSRRSDESDTIWCLHCGMMAEEPVNPLEKYVYCPYCGGSRGVDCEGEV